ncbi:substrate-binding domain-containing protein [Motiliproteus sp. MSK22-1]|uniref:substrate-binding domain-containing protein n=1 Tax=Motiliproteus sp. MSK22-1 TaxID=1897630 RepID=UPI0009783F19|nr:substrate-binding domain-containing protein [Motiliproteus sp. MSK22-1]OMH31657.1 ABC transporter substrate-binding protein [Motiliproteus sp. MSK22-1]
MFFRIFVMLFFAVTGLFSSLSLQAQPRDYWMVDEFLSTHPGQRAISQHFADQVRNAAQPLRANSNRPIRVSVIYPGEQVSDYWRRSVSSFEARMQELGIKYTLRSHYTKPAVALREQAEQIIGALEEEADFLIFTLDARRHRSIVERIIAAGKPKLILQNITTPIKAWGEQQPFMYVGFDHVEGTRLLADWYQERLPKAENYALVYWARGYVSEARGDSFIDFMRKGSNIQLSSAYYTDASRASAYQGASKAITKEPDLDFIYACSTDVALGVSDVINEYGKQGQILVNGWGGGSAELEALKAGRLDVTVMRMNDDNGVAMAEAIKLDIIGLGHQVPTIYSGDFELVTKDTPAKEIERLKQRAFRYSGVN